jgi:CheY-like chemotaxis protein
MGSKRLKILCVEDDQDACKMFQALLPDFELVSAATKAEAIEKAREGRFALIFMDYRLPDGTGEETCRLIRLFDSKTPILFITAVTSFTETRARSIGAQGSLKKASATFIDELKHRTAELTYV